MYDVKSLETLNSWFSITRSNCSYTSPEIFIFVDPFPPIHQRGNDSLKTLHWNVLVMFTHLPFTVTHPRTPPSFMISVKCKNKCLFSNMFLTITFYSHSLTTSLKLRCDTRFQRAFTSCSCVVKIITLVWANQGNYFENATANAR